MVVSDAVAWMTLAALVGLVLAAVTVGRPLVGRWLRAAIRRRLDGYHRVEVEPEPHLPERVAPGAQAPRVAIIGGGVAGLTAATTLAARGLRVVVFEAKGHVGGKLGSWPVEWTTGPDGARETVWASHGFHAFFRHYFNLNRWLDSLGGRRTFRAIDDYAIIAQDGDVVRFGRLETTPILNLFAMSRAGIYKLTDSLHAPQRDVMGVLLEYDGPKTFRDYDHLSFADFDRFAQLPPRLRLAFGTFSRAFFADDDKISLAELVKSFHFYYLSHDHGLLYDYPTRDYEPTILAPARARITDAGGEVRTSTPVESLAREDRGFTVNGERFDDVIVATDVVGARRVITGATGLPDALRARFDALRPGQRYAVWRIWTDRDVRADLPVFVITDKVRVLDAIAVYHRVEEESANFVARHGGAILELHCYAVPEDLVDEAELRADFRREVVRFFPELEGFEVRAEVIQLERNFTAFHVGAHATRPTADSGVEGLSFAGDWVRLDFPAMLLEGACASGLVAANRVLGRHGLRSERVESVPLRGVMAGAPEPPGRAHLKAMRRPPAG